MAEGYDGRDHVEVLKGLLPAGSSVLELGMGPGKDLDMLALHFEVVGSDASRAFLDRYRASHPDCDVRLLDAVTIEVEELFDAIYSNKVLQHLGPDEVAGSLARQAEVVRPGGLLLHGIWVGSGTEEYEGEVIHLYDRDSFAAAAPTELEIVDCVLYEEMEPEDSLRITLRRSI